MLIFSIREICNLELLGTQTQITVERGVEVKNYFFFKRVKKCNELKNANKRF